MKVKALLTAGILIIVTIFLLLLFTQSSKPSKVDIKDDKLVISGMFSTAVALSDIESVELTEFPPDIAAKTNGSGLGSKYKGEFLLAGNTKARLYIDASIPPFAVFKAGDTVFYINLDTPEKTKILYRQLTAAIG